MTYEAPYETTGAPDGEFSYPHSDPTITEAWRGYEYGTSNSQVVEPHRADNADRLPNQLRDLARQTQEQLANLQYQVEDKWQSDRLSGNPFHFVTNTVTQWLRENLQENRWMKTHILESEGTDMRENINTNINTQEVKRWSALMGGGFLALFGLRRSLGSLTMMGFGLGLAYYALTGRSPLAQVNTRFTTRANGKRLNESGVFSQGSSLDSVSPVTVKSIIVKAPLDEVYQAWSDFENFPRFMQHIRSVTKGDDNTSHWMMEGPFHTRLEWDAEMTRHEENKRIAWSSIRGDIKTSGQVTFNALPDEQVEVTVMLKYIPPAGLAGDLFARLFSNPEGKLDEDLRNFKRYIEASAKENNGSGTPEQSTEQTAEPVTA